MHAGADFHFPRDEAVLEEDAAQIAEHDACINAVRAVNGATVAAGALAPGSVHALDHELGVNLAFAAQQLAQRSLNLVRGNLRGIVVVGAVEKAAVRAHGAVRTDAEPCAGARFAGLLKVAGQGFLVDLHFLHLGIILRPALVLQQIKDAFLGGDGGWGAQQFGHGSLLSGEKIIRLPRLPGESAAARCAASFNGKVHADLRTGHKEEDNV